MDGRITDVVVIDADRAREILDSDVEVAAEIVAENQWRREVARAEAAWQTVFAIVTAVFSGIFLG